MSAYVPYLSHTTWLRGKMLRTQNYEGTRGEEEKLGPKERNGKRNLLVLYSFLEIFLVLQTEKTSRRKTRGETLSRVAGCKVHKRPGSRLTEDRRRPFRTSHSLEKASRLARRHNSFGLTWRIDKNAERRERKERKGAREA